MITIAGSGPSATQLEHVDVATKKRSVSSDYIFSRTYNIVRQYIVDPGTGRISQHPPLMIYYRECGCTSIKCAECKEVDKYYPDAKSWDEYYTTFSSAKPSTGLCAVFTAVERWKPDTIGLIGFDWVLDGNEEWAPHNAVAELAAMQSLAEIKDLRL